MVNSGRTKKADLCVVLVGPRVPANIGACARLLANFDVKDGRLVRPQCAWDQWDAKRLATGSARRTLEAFRVCASVEAAVADCQLAIGFTRRLGRDRRPTFQLTSLPEHFSNGRKIALVFGNEETGLSTQELQPCTHLCTIPTSEDHPSLNLSHAVSIALSYATTTVIAQPARTTSPARLALLEAMMDHWREFLLDVGLDRAGNPERILHRLRAVLERSEMSTEELRAFRGVLSKAQVKLGTRLRGRRVAPLAKR